jgi:uncharacterized membrane protein
MLSFAEGNGAKGTSGGEGEEATAKPSDRSRWIAAVGYIFCVCLFSLWKAGKDPFIRAHAAQAVLLFIAECAALAAAAILSATVGRIEIVGLIVMVVFELLAALAALILSIAGIVKALFGEDWRMPFLGEFRDKVPGFQWHED